MRVVEVGGRKMNHRKKDDKYFKRLKELTMEKQKEKPSSSHEQKEKKWN